MDIKEKYELIRTVDHTYDDGSDSVLQVTAMVTPNDVSDGVAGVAVIDHELGGEGGE